MSYTLYDRMQSLSIHLWVYIDTCRQTIFKCMVKQHKEQLYLEGVHCHQ